GEVRMDQLGRTGVERQGGDVLQRPAATRGRELERGWARVDAVFVGREDACQRGADAEPQRVAGGEDDGRCAAVRDDLLEHGVEVRGMPRLEFWAAPST